MTEALDKGVQLHLLVSMHSDFVSIMCDVHPVSCLVSAGGSFLRGKMYLELEAYNMPPSNVKFNLTYRDSFTIYIHSLCNNLCHRLYISCLDCNDQHFVTHMFLL